MMARRLLAEALRAGHEGRPVDGELTVGQDAVRLAVGALDASLRDRLADGWGRSREDLELAVRAWEYGGAAALSVLEEEWTVQGEALARVRTALDTAWEDGARPQLRAGRNRWTVADGRAQLRLGRDGRWWPYRKVADRWEPAGPAAGDPATALAVM